MSGMVVARTLEDKVEKTVHPDSYRYRRGGIARISESCTLQRAWVIRA